MEIKKYPVFGRFHARFDSFAGLIPVKPMRKIIHKDQNRRSVYIRVKVLETVGAYKKGEILEIRHEDCIPLSHIKYSKGSHEKIFGNFEWLDLWPEENNSSLYRGIV